MLLNFEWPVCLVVAGGVLSRAMSVLNTEMETRCQNEGILQFKA